MFSFLKFAPMRKSLSQNLPIILMCCSVFNHLLPQTPVCCHGNDSSTNTGLGLSGRRREIMNKQLCSIISNSMKKPQNAEFRWVRPSPCLNTGTGAAAPHRDSHSTQGSWAERVLPGSAICPAAAPVCPLSPARSSPQLCTVPKATSPSPGNAEMQPGAPQLRRALLGQGTPPACPDHGLQLTAAN